MKNEVSNLDVLTPHQNKPSIYSETMQGKDFPIFLSGSTQVS